MKITTKHQQNILNISTELYKVANDLLCEIDDLKIENMNKYRITIFSLAYSLSCEINTLNEE